MENSVDIPHINVVIDEADINGGAKKILKIIRPSWNISRIHFKLLTDGITNKLVGCKPADAPEEETVLVRVYGNKTDLLIDRKAETRNIILLNNAGLAPNLYATFENGLAYRFIPGCTLNERTVILPEIYELVAKQMARLHKVHVPGNKLTREPCLWKKLQKFLDLVPEQFSDSSKNERNIILLNNAGLAPNLYATFENGLAYRFIPGCTLNERTVILPEIYELVAKQMARLHKVHVPGNKLTREPCLWKKLQKFLDLVPEQFSDSSKNERYQNTILSKSKISKEIDELKQILTQMSSPIVFSHNDLLLGNVIFTEKENCVTFIDYEYAALNYQAYDIGNHFAEFAGIETVDYSKYPKKDLQLEWLTIYLTEYEGKTPTNNEVENLYIQVNKFCLAAHVFWGIWALIQAEHSYIDFDFLGYAAIRFNEYLNKKEEFLSLELPR